MPKSSKTHVLIVLDESGSMSDLRKDVIDGSNTYVSELKEEAGSYVLKIVRFDSRKDKDGSVVRPIFDWTPLDKVRKLTSKDYAPTGGTPLYDAVGQALQGVEIPKGDKGLCIVYTDGEENSSREWTASKVKVLIEELEAKNWGFVYLGAGLAGWTGDAIAMGFAAGSTYASVDASAVGTAHRMSALRGVTSTYTNSDIARSDLLRGAVTVDSLEAKAATPVAFAKPVSKAKRKV